ncbi:DOMON domain-containing protein [Thermococcus sp.]
MMWRKTLFVLAVLIIAVVMVLGTGHPKGSPSKEIFPSPPGSSPQSPATSKPSPSSTHRKVVPWKPDGVIEDGEYQRAYKDGDFELYLRVENGTLMVGMRAPTRGWLAVGFGGERGMKGADIIIAYVLPNGTVMVSDEYSTGFSGPHNPNGVYGGTDDVLSYGGSEGPDYTVVEFSRKLDTGDRHDFKIPPAGKFRVIWAYALEDDFLSMHAEAGSFYAEVG